MAKVQFYAVEEVISRVLRSHILYSRLKSPAKHETVRRLTMRTLAEHPSCMVDHCIALIGVKTPAEHESDAASHVVFSSRPQVLKSCASSPSFFSGYINIYIYRTHMIMRYELIQLPLL